MSSLLNESKLRSKKRSLNSYKLDGTEMETVHYITNINLRTEKVLENSNISASKYMLLTSLRSKRFCLSFAPKMEPEQKSCSSVHALT